VSRHVPAAAEVRARPHGHGSVRLAITDLDAELVVAFLDELADQRAASTATYNLRLTAIRAFFWSLALEEPAYSGQIQRVLTVPSKIATKREVSFLLRAEIEAILMAGVGGGL
jgi:integrase/recombinase XerD